MATTNPSSLVNAYSQVIEERLSGGIQESYPRLDPFYKEMHSTSMGVDRGGALGRDLKVIHPMYEGVSGAFKWQSSSLGAQPSQWGTSHIINPGNVDEYPGLDETTNPGFFHKEISLAKGHGNMFVPQELLRVDKLPATVGRLVHMILKGTAQNVALSDIQCFYATDSFKSIGTIGDVSNSGATTVASIKNQSVRGLFPGIHVDVYDSTGATQRNVGVKLVLDGTRFAPEAADVGYGEVTIRRKDGGTFADLSIVATDIIVRAESISNGPLGPAQWLINTGTIFGINLSTYQQFKSIVDSAVSAVLTEQLLNKYWGRSFKAYGLENMPDCLLTSDGVTNAYVNNSDGFTTIERNSQRRVIEDGWELSEVPYTYHGRKMKWKISSFMPSTSDFSASTHTGGKLWALKTRDRNIVRYLAPTLPGARSDEMFGTEIEFVYPLGGEHGIFKPYHSSSGKSTNYQEAPFDHYIAVAPEWIPGIALGGLTEVL